MNLFDFDAYGNTVPAQRHSPTSVEAAKSIEPHVNEMHKRILRRLKEAGETGCTDEDLQADFATASTSRPRRVELVRMGLVKDSGKTRLTKSLRRACVWVLA